MESLISVINKLQDVFNTVSSEALQLPQIVVIGSQSAGKSSVIESLVGRNFLPRGTGIVTRRPLILQLIYCPIDDKEHRSVDKGTSDLEEWGVFLHKPDIFSNFDEIRKEIEDETDRVAGSNKGIVHDPINLKVFSSRVVNLTLVDLPGITKVPVGDQPEDIEEQIKELVFKYIRNPNSIILAVSAANTDLATSEALKFGREVDPDGKRTLAVLTKLDLMDEGTNAVEVLSGNVIPVKLGIIGVVNRSQQAIIDNKDIDEQLKFESKFLKEKYPKLAHKNGTKYLAETLRFLLINHIKECLPDLRKQVNDKSLEYQTKMNGYGKALTDQNQTLIQIITNFSAAYIATLDGKAVNTRCGSTKLYEIIHHKFEDCLENIEPKAKMSKKDDLVELSAGNGPHPTLFNMPMFDGPFEKCVKENVQMLRDPSLECVEWVRKEMQRLISNCGAETQQEMKRFPKLHHKIENAVQKMLKERLEIVKNKIEDLIEIETAYINKNHPDFKKHEILIKKLESPGLPPSVITIGGQSFDNHMPSYQSGYANQNSSKSHVPIIGQDLTEKQQKVVLDELIRSYFHIVRKSLQDSVPKTIMHFLVNFVKKNVQTYLLANIYTSATAEELLKESKLISEGRKEASETLEALHKANLIIGDISEFTIDEWDYE